MDNDKPEFKYFFSVVTACYNVELYVEEAIKSILKQTIGFKEHIQLILVDDGSTDNTAKILDKYASKYPYNIFAVHKENGGVSSARNAGLKYVQGKYVNFLDADDKFSPESFQSVYAFFQFHYEETDVVTVPIYFFEGRTGGHVLNNKFDKGDRIIDLYKEPNYPLKHVNATFFKNIAIRDYLFDESLAISEDVKFCCDILNKKMKCGVCSEPSYFYRYRSTGAESALQNQKHNIKYYTTALSNCYEYVLKLSNANSDSVKEYYQYCIIDDLYWRLLSKEQKPKELSVQEWENYKQSLKNLAKYLDDECIVRYKKFYADHRYFLLYHKYNREPRFVNYQKDVLLKYDNITFRRISSSLSKIEIITLDNRFLHVEGYIRLVGVSDGKAIKIAVGTGKKKYYCKIINRNNKDRYLYDFAVYRDVGFSVDIPVEENLFSIYCCINNEEVVLKKLSFGRFSPIGKEYKNCYFYNDGWVLTLENNKLCLSKCGRRGYIKHEINLLKEIYKNKQYRYFFGRLYYQLHKMPRLLLNKTKKKEYWLVSDRVNKGDDNGEAFFDYLQKNKRKQVKSEFLIQKSSPDFRRIKKIGKVTPILSRKHKLHYLLCDKVVDSSGDDFTMRPIKGEAFRDIMANKKYVFLQHGITKDDISDWMGKYNKNAYKIVAATVPEYQSFLMPQYHYDENNIILTGFPRYDKLYNDMQKQIVIMPSWRKWLLGENKNGEWVPLKNFDKTEFYQFFNNLLTDKRLLAAAKETGYTIALRPHPHIYQTYMQYFNYGDGVKVIPLYKKFSEIFAESDLLVTDYSSVAFDFAYLRKPVVYSQFDSEAFFSGNHTYTKGYFDYETMGFGEVCPDLQSTVDTLIDYMQNGCSLKEKYKQRIESTFPYNDKNNCQRVYKNIKDD